MRLLFVGALALICSTVNAAPNASISTLLTQMNLASKEMDYEIYYVQVNKSSIEPMRYRHAVMDKQSYAQLTYLSSPARAVIRKANEVTYFEPGFDPYTIKSERIMAPIPVLVRNFSRLMQYYNFVSLGRLREAGLSSHVVRITPKDGFRYSYVLWVDEKSKLLVRADLLDKNGELLEQIRAVKLNISPSITQTMKQELKSIQLPPLVNQTKQQKTASNWSISAVPDGFVPITHNSYRLLKTARPVENIMYSDGLFSFSVYFSQADNLSLRERFARNGSRTLYSQVKGNVEVTVVGDIPPEQAKEIVQSVRLRASVPFAETPAENGSKP